MKTALLCVLYASLGVHSAQPLYKSKLFPGLAGNGMRFRPGMQIMAHKFGMLADSTASQGVPM